MDCIRRREYYGFQVASDTLGTARNCQNCTQLPISPFKRQKLMKLFPVAGPLAFAVVSSLGLLRSTTRGNLFTILMTDRFIKPTCYLLLYSTAASTDATAF